MKPPADKTLSPAPVARPETSSLPAARQARAPGTLPAPVETANTSQLHACIFPNAGKLSPEEYAAQPGMLRQP